MKASAFIESPPSFCREIRPTRTLSEQDGVCSPGVRQHPATALHRHLAVQRPIRGFESSAGKCPSPFSLPIQAVNDQGRYGPQTR